MSELEKILENIKEGGQHAFLIVGNPNTVSGALRCGIEKVFKTKTGTNPDYQEMIVDKFDVKDAREIRTSGQKSRMGAGHRFSILGADIFLEGAQNALLKLLEEPLPGHIIFIIAPEENGLLLTVRSRLHRINIFSEVIVGDALSHKFLRASVQDRLLMIPEIADEELDPSKQRIAVKNFIVNLKKKVFDEYKGRDFYDKKVFEKVMSEIGKAEKYSGDVASSPRLLLEFLSFICPRILTDEK